MTTTHAVATRRPAKVVRCAAYTRKSTEEGLDQEFNSLDAQREAAQAYVASQRHEGWIALPNRYDDGGYTGGNMDRPALARLLADIRAGKVDVVVVYKVDRLSRSLLDFAKMMETFDQYHVSFVSVTQQFNTATSMGRLVLNVLLSFAQFEREIISERTRDKIAAARRKGKWSGGHPLLGYDVDPHGSKLVINKPEAARVRAIFGLYQKHQGLIPVVQELERRGWVNKRWTTRNGRTRGGRPFTKEALHRLLGNVVYAGRIKYKKEVHDGEQAGIIGPEMWQAVQSLLHRNGCAPPVLAPGKAGAMLKGLLRCAPCGCAMTPSFATKDRVKRYRYYVCCNAQRRGWGACPSKSLPAAEIERFVLGRVEGLYTDEALLKEVIEQADRLEEVEPDGSRPAHEECATMSGQVTDASALARALSDIGSLEGMAYEQKVRVLRMVVERVDYYPHKASASVTFRAVGILALAAELAGLPKENPQ